MVIINIEIISDIVCAWCYIGKRTLERAISIHQKTYPGGRDDIFNICFQPYYLDYTSILIPANELKKSGAVPTVDKTELAKAKLGHMTQEQKDALEKRMNQIGRSLGINFRSGGKIGSTRAAHHLIHLSQMGVHGGNEVTNELVGRLFEAYHELEMDISAREVLRQIAVEVGLDQVDVDACLDFCFESDSSASTSSFASAVFTTGETGNPESIVDKQARENRQRTNTGVPLFIIQGEYHVDGAQDLMEFVEIFGKIRGSTDVAE
ncbi:DSBA-like thioredoxin domain protein [Talaromyces pinophilus]|uniref:DSBA-like thioredoxin domain protein n=1 Tax=Talaromyces pinophilus TaxID=128442 RepID=A0A478ED49_TALPI|nr:hypothetical protein PENOC_101730 [Penicillium occitanis (nom. inval.)]PCG98972.1 Hypothetical protein PENO1_055360 [Penicillium occitanis (nom. inval.)]GAM42793.1 DSBA-like thioredoxin domain protein [Talaromyces pinophilus]